MPSASRSAALSWPGLNAAAPPATLLAPPPLPPSAAAVVAFGWLLAWVYMDMYRSPPPWLLRAPLRRRPVLPGVACPLPLASLALVPAPGLEVGAVLGRLAAGDTGERDGSGVDVAANRAEGAPMAATTALGWLPSPLALGPAGGGEAAAPSALWSAVVVAAAATAAATAALWSTRNAPKWSSHGVSFASLSSRRPSEAPASRCKIPPTVSAKAPTAARSSASAAGERLPTSTSTRTAGPAGTGAGSIGGAGVALGGAVGAGSSIAPDMGADLAPTATLHLPPCRLTDLRGSDGMPAVCFPVAPDGAH